MTYKNHSSIDYVLKSMLILLISFSLLYVGSSIIMPLIFSGFMAVFLLPMTRLFERILPKSLSALISILISFAVFTGIIFLIVLKMNQMVASLPEELKNPTEQVLKDSSTSFTKDLGINKYQFEKVVNQSIEKFTQGSIEVLKSTLLGIKEAVLFFMLMYRKNILAFYLEFFKRKGYRIGPKILFEINDVLQEYLKGLFFVVLIVSTLTSIGLLVLGIDYAIFIGVLSGFLTLIPFVGVILSALLPMVLAYFTKDSLWYPALVLGIYALVQFLEGNFITPKIMGNKVNVNPLIIIVSLVIMGALAGIIGVVFTVPFLAIAKVVIDHSPELKPWKYLIEETPSEH